MKILFEYNIIVRAKKRGIYISHLGKVIAENGREIRANHIEAIFDKIWRHKRQSINNQ